jgi:hypothetical protein
MLNGQTPTLSATTSKKLTRRLYQLWGAIIETPGIHPEIAYRVGKLVHKLDTIYDKMFVKTVKAQEILTDCDQMTQEVQQLLDSPTEPLFSLLTKLETHFNELVKTTHEFRVKAG